MRRKCCNQRSSGIIAELDFVLPMANIGILPKANIGQKFDIRLFGVRQARKSQGMRHS
jgi:hypothetical protein